MNTTIATEIWTQLANYVSSLDWSYILTFIIISYGINNRKITAGIKKVTKVHTQTKYRVVLIGLLYTIALYFIRGYALDKVECLFQSFVFALVFHKLIIEGLTKYINKKLAKSIPIQPNE